MGKGVQAGSFTLAVYSGSQEPLVNVFDHLSDSP